MLGVLSIPFFLIFFVELARTAHYFKVLAIPPLLLLPFVLNLGLLYSFVFALFALSRRLLFSVILPSIIYGAWASANQLKISYLSAAIQPLDLLYLREFIPYLAIYFSPLYWVGLVCVAGGSAFFLWRLLRMPSVELPAKSIVGIGLGACAAPFMVYLFATAPGIGASLHRFGVGEYHWNSVESNVKNGLLLDFLLQLEHAVVRRPDQYSAAEVRRISDQYGLLAGPAPVRNTVEKADLVIYFFESLMDPQDLGLRFSSEPMPHLRSLMSRHSSGVVYVPGKFGGSGDAEFELFTGMSMRNLPPRSSPYKSYLKRDLPSLVRLFKEHGYQTSGFHVDASWMYNRREVYPRLGFDTFISYAGQPNLPLDPGRRYVADCVLTAAALGALEQAQPQFIFIFPNSTHGAYNYGAFDNSDLEVLDPAEPTYRKEIKTYINALREADKTLADLVARLEKRSRKTFLLVVGDHQPPMKWNEQREARIDARDRSKQGELYKTPVLLWSNFSRSRKDIYMSLNMLGGYLLNEIGIVPKGLFAFNEQLREQLPVVSHFIKDREGSTLLQSDAAFEKYRVILEDYRTLQYDLLFGERYSLPSSFGK
jgi:phosphoglycerol transferase MdoB-like AlkP superfamily enzyme